MPAAKRSALLPESLDTATAVAAIAVYLNNTVYNYTDVTALSLVRAALGLLAQPDDIPADDRVMVRAAELVAGLTSVTTFRGGAL